MSIVCPGAERDETSRADVERIATVELEPHLRDEPIARPGDRLQERDVVRRRRVGQLDLPPLAPHVRERADPPRCPRVAVDRVRGTIIGRVAHRVAVAGRVDPRDSSLLDGRHGVVARTGEDLEPVVGGIVDQRLLAGSLGDPDVLSNRSPSTRLPSVRVGQHEVGVVVERALHAVGVVRERRRIEHGLVFGDDPGGRRVDDALAAARHEHHAVGVLGSHDRRACARRGTRRPGADRRHQGECRVRPRR